MKRELTQSLIWGSMILFALIAYTLPWIVNPGAGLSMGADDLAEWASLHPQVRLQSPSLLTSLLLRVPLICLAAIIGFHLPSSTFSKVGWWFRIALTCIIAGFMLPPMEFSLSSWNDPNYRQQFILAVIALILGISGITLKTVFPRAVISTTAVIVGIVASIAGLEQSNALMIDLVLPAQRGSGAFIFCILLLCSGITEIKKRVTIGYPS